LCHLELGDLVPHACEDFQEEEFQTETSNPKKPRGRKPKMSEEEKEEEKAKKKQAQSARLAKHLRAAASKAAATASGKKSQASEAEAEVSSAASGERSAAAESAIKAAAQKHVTGAQFNNSVQKKKFGLGANIKNTPELEELSSNLEQKLKDGAKASSALKDAIALKQKDNDRITKAIAQRKKSSLSTDGFTFPYNLVDDDDCILIEDPLPPSRGSSSSTSSSSSSESSGKRKDPSKQMNLVVDGFDDAVMDLIDDYAEEVATAEEHLFALLRECSDLNKTIAEINARAKKDKCSKKKASAAYSFYWPAAKRQKLSLSGSDDDDLTLDDLMDYPPGPSKITLRKPKPEPLY
jgi:hypothetical protein